MIESKKKFHRSGCSAGNWIVYRCTTISEQDELVHQMQLRGFHPRISMVQGLSVLVNRSELHSRPNERP